jgi:hypothetical protein
MLNFLIEEIGSRERIDSPSPDTYDTLPGMKVVKESSPEWT